MDGSAKYAALRQGVEDLISYSRALDNPIDGFIKQMSAFNDSYGGTTSEAVQPVLIKIKEDIKKLQLECDLFAKEVNADLENYIAADIEAKRAMDAVVK